MSSKRSGGALRRNEARPSALNPPLTKTPKEPALNVPGLIAHESGQAAPIPEPAGGWVWPKEIVSSRLKAQLVSELIQELEARGHRGGPAGSRSAASGQSEAADTAPPDSCSIFSASLRGHF